MIEVDLKSENIFLSIWFVVLFWTYNLQLRTTRYKSLAVFFFGLHWILFLFFIQNQLEIVLHFL